MKQLLHTTILLIATLSACVLSAANEPGDKNSDANLQRELSNARQLTRTSMYKEAEDAYLNIISKYNDEIIKARTYIDLSEMYFMTGNAEKTLKYAQLANDIESVKDSTNITFRIKYLEASTYLSLGTTDKCDSVLTLCGKELDKVTDKEALSKYYYVYGKYKFATNDYLNGIRHLQQASMQYSSEIITPEYGRVLLLIAQMYQIKNDIDLAQRNAEEALIIFDTKHFNVSKIDALCLIGDLYIQRNDPESAHKYYLKAKEQSESLNAIRGKMTANLRIANWYLMQDKIDSALIYTNFTPDNNRNMTNLDLWFNTSILLSRYYLRHNDIAKATSYADMTMDLSKNVKSWSKLYELNRLLGSLCYYKHDYRQSSEHLRKAQLYADSLNARLALINADSLGIKQELNRQNDLINYLQSDNLAKEFAIEGNENIINKQKTSIFSLIGLSLVISILMCLLVLQFFRKIKANKALKESNIRMSQQNEEIEAQKAHLLDYNRELEKLSLIARETDNAIRVFDNEGNTIWINIGYTKLYGYTLKDLMMNDSLGLSDKKPIDIKHIIENWNYDKPSIELESEITNKWNIKLWVQTTLSPIFDDEDMTIRNLIAIDTNITSLKKAQQEIISMNNEITDSILYAKRIQEAMLPHFDILTNCYPDSFRYYKPRSIVSGDFYWMSEQSGRLIVACADSTGHGVPGAFLSLIGISFLSKIVNERGITQPSTILNRLRANIISHLHQEGKYVVAGDGMDMSIISIDKRNYIMEFAGAMTPMYIIRDKHLIELRPDRMPVGYYDNENRAFSSSKVALKHGDQLYMFSDGYLDQFGGTNGLKMKTTKFKEILQKCCQKSNETQIMILETEFNAWRGSYDQVDDILVLGIQIK